MKALLRTSFLVLSAVLIASACEAQINQISDGDRIQQLLKRIDQLEASQKAMQEKIDNLQTTKPLAEPAPEPMPEPAAEQPKTHVLGPVEFHGFSDFDYGKAWFEKPPPAGLKGSTKSFNIGDFDLYTNTRLSDRWSMLGEMLVSSDFSNEFGVEMDRLLLTYKRNQYFKISFVSTQLRWGTTPMSSIEHSIFKPVWDDPSCTLTKTTAAFCRLTTSGSHPRG
jgi:hypothetical protein